jgi:hypothetical protein
MNNVVNDSWCFKYPNDKDSIWIKTIFLLIIIGALVYMIFDKFDVDNVGIWALIFLVCAGVLDVAAKLHRIMSYDQVCRDGEYLVIKKKEKILSKTPISKIHVISTRNPFNFSRITWHRLYHDDTLLFHYQTNEIDDVDNKNMTTVN